MGITGLLPFIEKASKRVNVSEFNGCTVAIDSYCWLHKGAFACADKLVRGEDTDIHIKYCMKYVNMLLSKNIKPILVFDGRHLPAKAMTETKRRESRNISKKRAAELLSLGKIEEARSYMRRSVDITHEMALNLIKECRNCNVDCIVAPYEADAQLAYLNIKNIAHLVITEDSDLILFGCTKVLFKMDLDGTGTLVETAKLPLVMKCPIEQYKFDKFRQMCIMSGCDYLASLPGIGLAKARQFVTATQDNNFANALKKLPSFFNKSSLVVSDEYRENFLKAEATFKHQYVYDPIERKMVRLTDPDDEDIEKALCVNAGELLEPNIAFELALGNLDPFTLRKMDDWHPDCRNNLNKKAATKLPNHPSIWSEEFKRYIDDESPWLKKVKEPDAVLLPAQTRPRKKVVNMVTKYVPETQDESLSIQTLTNMYCIEPNTKRQKIDEHLLNHDTNNLALNDEEIIREVKDKSPILKNKERSFKKCLQNGSYSVLKRLSRFPRTVLDTNIVESKFFSTIEIKNEIQPVRDDILSKIDESDDAIDISNSSQKENSPCNSPVKTNRSMLEPTSNSRSPVLELSSNSKSPILEPSPRSKNPFKRKEVDVSYSQDSVIENTYPMETLITPVDSQESFGQSQPKPSFFKRSPTLPVSASQPNTYIGIKKSNCRVPGLKRTNSLPSNQPTLLSKFGFQKKPVLKR